MTQNNGKKSRKDGKTEKTFNELVVDLKVAIGEEAR